MTFESFEDKIKRYLDNAEYERTHGNLQGCLEFKQLADWLKELKQLWEQTRWIPVSERLPEVGSEVLVCYEFKDKRSVYIADFYGDGKFHGLDDEYLTTEGRKYRKAIAWMPLPTPPNKSEILTGSEGSDKE